MFEMFLGEDVLMAAVYGWFMYGLACFAWRILHE